MHKLGTNPDARKPLAHYAPRSLLRRPLRLHDLQRLHLLLLRLAVGRLLKQTGELQYEGIGTQRKHYASLILYLIAIPLAHFHPYLALAAITLVTVVWIVPTAATPACADDPLDPSHPNHTHLLQLSVNPPEVTPCQSVPVSPSSPWPSS